VRSGSINHNGTALKIVRASVANNAPSNVVRLSGLPLSTTEESLAKILVRFPLWLVHPLCVPERACFVFVCVVMLLR